ncbi:MAG: sodium:proton exchanger [Candidatus Yanofskybacteria bacterium CG10_big_fil_rev_8_21_14_0_10_37_15]|uniref:Sodium:proton exchanger n=1 Tax=Candidatus Yanofskybacteria bacterium CG10_big_fil_rev_8_21_14_0_10_37_15 TaxID=1975097 RepID=A0A2H0R592_9BACT|nr:MAG: sodium:proton exchanger [Candidatus Yanofskybacteria bacterium CG10_big_fil_rev_8_21_14_0_10_37_15]
MIWSLVFFIFGFFILIKGSDILIYGSQSIAKTLNISNWIIGIVIVGIGTSIPELGITLSSVMQGQVDIGLGTVIGSNTFNILFILGLISVIYPINAKRDWIYHDLTANVFAILLTGIIVIFPILGGKFFEISKGEGIILLITLVVWILHLSLSNKIDHATDIDDPKIKSYPLRLSIIMIIVGLAGVIVGADWVINGAKSIATQIGLSEAVIGLTIVAVGTSLPELTVSFRAAYRKNFGISLGNIVGSNIFDFLGILGITALFQTLEISKKLTFDLSITFISSLILLTMMFTGKKYILQKWSGGIMLFAYALYIFLIL